MQQETSLAQSALPKIKNQKNQNQTYCSANVIITTKPCNHTKLLKSSVSLRKLQDYTKYSSYGNKSYSSSI